MNILLTGSNGFSAFHMTQFIERNELAEKILGIDIHDKNKNALVDVYYSLDHFDTWVHDLETLRGETRIFHFGGLVGSASLDELVNANVYWTAKFLDAAARVRGLRSLLNVGSSAEYGVQTTNVLHEHLAPRPVTAYGISKHLQTQLALEYGRVNDVPVLCTRTFNLCGPKQSDKFVLGSLLTQFTQVRDGLRNGVTLGRVDSERDFIDVRDAVEIYWALSVSGHTQEICNVGSGTSRRISDVFDLCCEVFGFRPPLVLHEAQPHAADIDSQCADISRLQATISKTDFISLETTIRDMATAR